MGVYRKGTGLPMHIQTDGVKMDGVWYVVLHCDGSRLCFQVGN